MGFRFCNSASSWRANCQPSFLQAPSVSPKSSLLPVLSRGTPSPPQQRKGGDQFSNPTLCSMSSLWMTHLLSYKRMEYWLLDWFCCLLTSPVWMCLGILFRMGVYVPPFVLGFGASANQKKSPISWSLSTGLSVSPPTPLQHQSVDTFPCQHINSHSF